MKRVEEKINELKAGLFGKHKIEVIKINPEDLGEITSINLIHQEESIMSKFIIKDIDEEIYNKLIDKLKSQLIIDPLMDNPLTEEMWKETKKLRDKFFPLSDTTIEK